MSHRVNHFAASANRIALGLAALGSAGLAVAQHAAAPQSSGQRPTYQDLRAQDLRTALKNQKGDTLPANHKLSPQEREVIREQLREQGRDAAKPVTVEKSAAP
jgi:hypothetical protein